MQTVLNDDAEVVLLDLSETGEADSRESLELLSEDEKARAGAFRHDLRRRQFVETRAAVRRGLARRLDIDPAEVRLVTGPRGRPELVGGECWFNVAHSDHLALVAFRSEGAIGVDLQRLDPALPWRRLLARICDELELAEARAEARAVAHLAFFERWVAKEALLKALGCGLSVPPAQVRLSRRPDRSFQVLEPRSRPGARSVCEISQPGRLLPVGFCGAVAVANGSSAYGVPVA
jgi:phosphopantetheinyl transferase